MKKVNRCLCVDCIVLHVLLQRLWLTSLRYLRNLRSINVVCKGSCTNGDSWKSRVKSKLVFCWLKSVLLSRYYKNVIDAILCKIRIAATHLSMKFDTSVLSRDVAICPFGLLYRVHQKTRKLVLLKIIYYQNFNGWALS